jgi:hypothetical protein
VTVAIKMANPLPMLMTGEPGSFALHTMAHRLPAVVLDVCEANRIWCSEEQNCALRNIYEGLLDRERKIPELRTSQNDGPYWRRISERHGSKTWFEVPWFFAEAYLYRYM